MTTRLNLGSRGLDEHAARGWARAARGRTVSDLVRFVRHPSVSGDRRAARRCAGWLATHLRSLGLRSAEVVATRGNPAVIAEWRGAPGRATVLVYGHYDVQPPDPIARWTTPPYAGVVRDGAVVGRGACDDKGQLMAHVKAIESWLSACGALPCNVVCLFEGEEEIGSPQLPALLRAHRRRLRSDVAVVSDTTMRGPSRPALTYSLRGVLSLEILVRAAPGDLHCGIFGGTVPNAAQELCTLIASLADRSGRVAVPGFYDDVANASAAERAFMAEQGPSEAELSRAAGTRTDVGEPGFSPYERATIRPSMAVNGLVGGYQGRGVKAVIPSRAGAKVTFRLVPDQDPGRVYRLVSAHLARVAGRNVGVSVRPLVRARPAAVPRRHPAMIAAAKAYACGFGRPPMLIRSGGTVPVVDHIQRFLGTPVVMMGFALPADRMHSPNERFPISRYAQSIDTSICFLAEVGRRVPPRTEQ